MTIDRDIERYRLPTDRYHNGLYDVYRANLKLPLRGPQRDFEFDRGQRLTWVSSTPWGERKSGHDFLKQVQIPEQYRPGLRIATYSWGDSCPGDNQDGVLRLEPEQAGIEGRALFMTSSHRNQEPFRNLTAFVTLDDLAKETGVIWIRRDGSLDPSGLLVLNAIQEGQDWFTHVNKREEMKSLLIPKEVPSLKPDQINRTDWEPAFKKIWSDYESAYGGPASSHLAWRGYRGEDQGGSLPFTRILVPGDLREAFLVGFYSWARQVFQDSQDVWFGQSGGSLNRLGTALSYTPDIHHNPRRKVVFALFDEPSFIEAGKVWLAETTEFGRSAGKTIVNSGQEGLYRIGTSRIVSSPIFEDARSLALS